MTDFRSLCARMADELDHYRQLLMDDRREVHALAAESRVALAQPEPAVVSVINSGSERLRLAAVGIRSGYMAGHDATVEGYYGDPDEVASEMASMVLAELDSAPQPEPVAPTPTDEELWELYELERGEPGDWSWVRDYARAVLARWGHPTPPAPEVREVGLLVDRLNQMAGDIDFLCNKIVNGECRTVACLHRGGWIRGAEPVDPSVATCPTLETAGTMRRAATLLQQLSAPAPAVVAPTDDELWSVGNDDFRANCYPTDAIYFARAVLARWGNYQVSLASSTQPLPEQEVSE